MTKQEAIDKLMADFGHYGLTADDLERDIDDAAEYDLDIETAYIGLDMIYCLTYGVRHYYSLHQVAKVYGITEVEAEELLRQELQNAQETGIDTSQWMVHCPQPDTEYLM